MTRHEQFQNAWEHFPKKDFSIDYIYTTLIGLFLLQILNAVKNNHLCFFILYTRKQRV